MSSANVLQSLNTSADGAGVTSSNRRVSEIFIATGAITAGATVVLDLAQADNSDKALYVKEGIAAGVPVGVVENDYADGEDVTVILRGYIEEAKVDGTVAIAVGDALTPAVVGKSVKAGAADAVVAFAAEASSVDATSAIFVIKNF
jgi:ApbE superfamily uncharacterized protein (UPF0280 family)